jgi:hypothetical protein
MRSVMKVVASVAVGSMACVGACTKQSVDAGAPHASAAATQVMSAPDGAVGETGTGTVTATATATATATEAGNDAGAKDGGGDAADEAPVKVKLATIGMHVGGGPYDEITKEPMKRSVEPHFSELARCWKLAGRQEPTDVGVDLVIEAAGGRAKVSNPRTFAKGEGFVPCVVSFFEDVEFLKPRNGKTIVSYSVRFTP